MRKLKLADTAGDYSAAVSAGVVRAEARTEALKPVCKGNNRCSQAAKGKRPAELLRPQMPWSEQGSAERGSSGFQCGPCLFLTLRYSAGRVTAVENS